VAVSQRTVAVGCSAVVRCDGWDTEVLRVGAIPPERIKEIVKAARKGHPEIAPPPAAPLDEWDGG
jgi:hypothetical protein